MSHPDEPSRPMFDRLLHDGKVAVIFLSRVPVIADRPVTPEDLAASAPFFPLAGAGLGLVSALSYAAALHLGLPAPIAAALAILTLVLLTGALHEDGLADTTDGFGGGSNRSRRLEIMRDPRVGSFGVLALVLAVVLRV
ncbi:MAG: adenosylcobinamide-GDP ribazoletransferase, partial [Geminicoccaceae bacterium]|nr:adenosylcobinamide-GDP ribazoletransferase [Geminicoccaceae bacterium]